MPATSEPLHHIQRTPLPWRSTDTDKTVCGHPVGQYADGLVLCLVDARAMVRRLGQQRSAMTFCMTCFNRADSWALWDVNPVARMARELDRPFGLKADERDLVTRELRAIAALIEMHRSDFDELVVGLESVTTMAELRRMRADRTAQRPTHPGRPL